MGCEVTDRVAEWQIFGKMRQICSFFGLFCIPTHPYCCCRPHGRPLCSSWEASGFHAVDHRFLAWKPLFSDVQTDGFRRTNRWIPQNKLMDSAEQTAGIRRTNRRIPQNKGSVLGWLLRQESTGVMGVAGKAWKTMCLRGILRRICHSITPSVTLSVT